MENKKTKETRKFLIVCGGAGAGLLGQRSILRVDGELQIDVSKEIDESRSISDRRSDFIALDDPGEAKTALKMLHYYRERLKKGRVSGRAAKDQIEFLAEYWNSTVNLADGLARSPAIGGLTIRSEGNRARLDARLGVMLKTWSAGFSKSDDVEIWIISSTAGGTGEGVHRFVGERIIDLSKNKTVASVGLNFIRIGPNSYASVNKEMETEATTINSFFGIAADAAFKQKMVRKYKGVGFKINWFYLQVPDVGIGGKAKEFRAKLVEMACKSIMLDQLTEDINTLIVNDGIALVRVGFWGKDFDANGKYYVSLNQLIEKLDLLIAPTVHHETVNTQFAPGTDVTAIMENLKTPHYLLNKMTKGWKFEKFPQAMPRGKEQILNLAKNEWRQSINALILPKEIDKIAAKVTFVRTQRRMDDQDQEGSSREVQVPVFTGYEDYSVGWFSQIEYAKSVQAWAKDLLGEGEDGKYLDQLVKLAQKCSALQHLSFIDERSTSVLQKATALCQALGEFIVLIAKVIRLDTLERAMEDLLAHRLADVVKIREYAETQRLIAKAAARTEDVPIICSNLDKELDTLNKFTWLKLLYEAVRQDRKEVFREQVLRGATGLTRDGLLNVLDLKDDAKAEEIMTTLKAHVGQMIDTEGKSHEGDWWYQDPPGHPKFVYRIFPELDPELKGELKGGDDDVKFLYTDFGALGLYVLAFEGATLGTAQDTVAGPKYLLTDYVGAIKDKLNDENWQELDQGRTGAKLELAQAGVPGESLYKLPLVDLDFTEEEFAKLSEFYELYDPKEEGMNNPTRKSGTGRSPKKPSAAKRLKSKRP